MDIKFVCAINNERSFEDNIRRSTLYSEDRFILRRGYTNVPLAYNSIPEVKESFICYVHQDVFFPDDWEREFSKSLKRMDQIDKNWGVLGVAGVRRRRVREMRVRQWYGNIIDRGKQWGSPIHLPASVQTLDELLLIRRSRDRLPYRNSLKFDEKLPSNHFYGADICLQAQSRGQACYAINAPCHHNSTLRKLPADFHVAAEYMKEKWRSVLPIMTTCAILNK